MKLVRYKITSKELLEITHVEVVAYNSSKAWAKFMKQRFGRLKQEKVMNALEKSAALKLTATLQKIKDGKPTFYYVGQYLSLGLIELRNNDVKLTAKAELLLQAAII